MVFDVGERDVVCMGEVGEMRRVRGELAGFGEVDKGANAGGKELVEFLGGRLEWGPRIFTSEEFWGCPVRVWDGTRAVSVDGRKGRTTLRTRWFRARVDGDGGDVSSVSHFVEW